MKSTHWLFIGILLGLILIYLHKTGKLNGMMSSVTPGGS